MGPTFQAVASQLAEKLGLARAEETVINAVERGSAAPQAGRRSRDVITHVNRPPVKDLRDYNPELTRSEQSKSVLLLGRRAQNSLILALKR